MEPIHLLKKIVFVSKFPHNHCEISSHSRDLIEEFSKYYPEISSTVIALNDTAGHYDYPQIVQYEITESELSTYLQAADFINVNQFDIVCIQCEFRVLGNEATKNLLAFLEQLKIPSLTVVHSVCDDPDEEWFKNRKNMYLPSTHNQEPAQTVIEIPENISALPDHDKTCRDKIWQEITKKYYHSFELTSLSFRESALARRNKYSTLNSLETLPELKLFHLKQITDSTGVLQHAKYSFPDYSEGYCTDDNARALILTLLIEELNVKDSWLYSLMSRSIAFLNFAFNKSSLRFRNFLGYNREWLDDQGSEDSHGRAIWALGCCINRSSDIDLQEIANQLFRSALQPVTQFLNPRSCSFVLLGTSEYLKRFPGDRLCKSIELELCSRLLTMFSSHTSNDWPWCENFITYDNARIIQGILRCGAFLKRSDLIDTALKSLHWLVQIQTAAEGHFRAIGSNGFYKRGFTIAQFDQQPLEACAMVSTCIDAFKITGDHTWVKSAKTIFSWFLGRNDLGLALYDETTGGCRDALHADRVNRNQGAESTLSFLISLAEMYLLKKNLHS